MSPRSMKKRENRHDHTTFISAIERRRRGVRRERRFGPRRQRARRHRYGNQDRPDHALQRPGLRLWRDRPHRGRLFQDDQRAGRDQRPQDQFHQSRRRLQPAEDGRAGAAAGRGRKGRVPVPDARHPAEPGDPAISQRQQGAAAVRRHRRQPRSPIPSISRGRSATIRTTRPKRASTPSTFWRPSRTARSACSIRTTASARTI